MQREEVFLSTEIPTYLVWSMLNFSCCLGESDQFPHRKSEDNLIISSGAYAVIGIMFLAIHLELSKNLSLKKHLTS